jgi:acyl-CoA thioesterase-2
MAPYKEKLGDWYDRPRPIDLRYVTPSPYERTAGMADAKQQVWIRADGRLPDDPLLHACVVAYASDLTLLDTTTVPHAGGRDEQFMMASLDHAMWFHRPFRADEWLLYDMESPTSHAARGFAMGNIFSATGDLVVSVVQEGLIRPVGG